MATQPTPSVRRSERRRLSKAAVLIFETEDDAPTAPAGTVDVSEHGARIKSPMALTPGQVLEFRAEGDDRPVRCRVVWAGDMTSDRDAEAGLEFLMPPPV